MARLTQRASQFSPLVWLLIIAFAMAATAVGTLYSTGAFASGKTPELRQPAAAQEEQNSSFLSLKKMEGGSESTPEVYWEATVNGRVPETFRQKLAPDEFFAASIVNAALTFGLPEGTTVNDPPYHFNATHERLEKLRSCISAVDRTVHEGSKSLTGTSMRGGTSTVGTTWNAGAYTITFLGSHATRPNEVGLQLDPRVSVKSNNFLLEFHGNERIGFKPFDVRVAVLTYSNNPQASQNWGVMCQKA